MVHQPEDIAPGANRAVLTININRSIDLDSGKSGINISTPLPDNDGSSLQPQVDHSTRHTLVEVNTMLYFLTVLLLH